MGEASGLAGRGAGEPLIDAGPSNRSRTRDAASGRSLMAVPKITGGSLAEHRAATRARVFEAMATLLADRRFDKITMADLAATAGVGRSALYNHFKDSEAVVVAFACEETDRYLEALRSELLGATTATERLRRYIVHQMAARQEFHFGFGPELSAVLSAESRALLYRHVRDIESVLREILTAGVAAGQFHAPDLDQSIALIHATVQVRHATAEATVDFVLAALTG